MINLIFKKSINWSKISPLWADYLLVFILIIWISIIFKAKMSFIKKMKAAPIRGIKLRDEWNKKIKNRMGQSRKCFLCKQKKSSSISRTCVKAWCGGTQLWSLQWVVISMHNPGTCCLASLMKSMNFYFN